MFDKLRRAAACKACRACPSRRPRGGNGDQRRRVTAAASAGRAFGPGGSGTSGGGSVSGVRGWRSAIGLRCRRRSARAVARCGLQVRQPAVGSVAPVTCWHDCPSKPPESLAAASGGSLTVEPSEASCVDSGGILLRRCRAGGRQARTRYCRRTSFGGKPESSADSSNRATASAGGQPNSARFAAAENKSRCRSPGAGPLPDEVERRAVQGRRAVAGSTSSGLRFAFSRHQVSGGLPVGGGLFAGPRHGRHVERCRRLGQFKDCVQRSQQFVERQPALVKPVFGCREFGARKARTSIIDPGVDRHGGQFGDVFGKAPRRPVEVGRRCRRPERGRQAPRESLWTPRRKSAVRPVRRRTVPPGKRPAPRRPYGHSAILRRRCRTTATATSTAPRSPPSSRSPVR